MRTRPTGAWLIAARVFGNEGSPITMIQIHFERLRTLGLTPALASLATTLSPNTEEDSRQLMRLTEVHRETVRVHDGDTEHGARALPRLMRALTDEDSALAVGDWVLVERDVHGQRWVEARVPPLSRIVRRDADGRRHPVVSNVDTALLVMGLDDDFNPRRLERYLALVQSSDVLPVVVLTKADVIAQRRGARRSHCSVAGAFADTRRSARRRWHRPADKATLRSVSRRRPDAGRARLVGGR